jgi:hypothetical protein
MKYWSIRVVEGADSEDALESLYREDFIDDEICDKIVPKIEFTPIDEQFKSLEVEPCAIVDGCAEIVDEENAEFFSVYVRLMDNEARCITDLPSRELAEQFVKTIKSLIKHGKAIS